MRPAGRIIMEDMLEVIRTDIVGQMADITLENNTEKFPLDATIFLVVSFFCINSD